MWQVRKSAIHFQTIVIYLLLREERLLRSWAKGVWLSYLLLQPQLNQSRKVAGAVRTDGGNSGSG